MSVRAFTLFTYNPKAQNWLPVVTYPILFLSLQVLGSFHPSSDSIPFSPSELATVEALKLIFNVIIRYQSGDRFFRQAQRQSASVLWDASGGVEEQPLRGLTSQDGDEIVSLGAGVSQQPLDGEPTIRSWLTVVCSAVVWASSAYIFTSALFFFDAATVHFAAATSTALVLFGLYAFTGRPITAPVSQSIALQLLGILLAKLALSHSSQSSLTPIFILLSVAFSSTCNVLIIDNVYHSHSSASVNRLNTVLFFSGLCLHVAICVSQAFLSSSAELIPEWSLRRISALIIRARLDWTILSVIRVSLRHMVLSLTVMTGSAVALWASISYVSKELYKSHRLYDTAEYEPSVPTRRRRAIAWAIFIFLGLSSSILGAIETVTFRSEHSLAALDILSGLGQPACERRPLPFSPLSASHSHNYRHFDDVLLIIFFSHARYDTNLDTIAKYTRNTFRIFCLLARRIAKTLDSITRTMYLWNEHPCYDGYLWAPFDTLLNVPRLQLFDQNKFWYHSPFGRYVPNQALDPSANANASFHAPPANISPDPANMTTPWKGWGEDWWWGSPHVGLPVCMPALEKVPEAQRERLAALTGERDRLIGGSADTMYIPGRHRATFMSILALFLQTNCFLEIAAPTALHLALPHDEDILYVDHWWIWQPPFDTAFVRGKWAEGREVDTFHAFHWGEPSGKGGVWEPHPERVADVRRLLQDSAARQGILFPKLRG
ncbi:hypothetical protein B0F90DRAFT_1815769 [Multifurca ochricompacta]|uniref:Uncharacterized protein n=1 Tax=Multifurca ochricompacta TaxID=376703 RepID=A0AAD4M8I6_9AGAM|nr:hypothetical protein B0F90DRAFT_1815769 [Multifurca ochricompacta]